MRDNYVVFDRVEGKYRLKIIQDDMPESPREWDNLGHMICFGKYSYIGDKHSFKTSNEFTDTYKQEFKRNQIVCLLVYAYDHSGIAISTEPFHCSWDSGRIGYIYVTYEKIRKWFGVKHVTNVIKDKVIDHLIYEIKTVDQWLHGDTYFFQITDSEDEDIYDSCGGFYGSDFKENGMFDSWPQEIKKLYDPNYKMKPEGFYLSGQPCFEFCA